MESTSTVSLTHMNRQEALFLWMRRTGNTFQAWGRQMDMTGGALGTLCKQETMPTGRHAQLLALGVPEELLPRPFDHKPGPKPKQAHVAA